MGTFGETGSGSATTAAGFADTMAVTTAVMTEIGLVSKVTLRLSNEGAGHAACQGFAVIYTDETAEPRALCAVGPAADIADDAAMGEIDFAFAKAVLLKPGTYHIGAAFDGDAAGVALRYAAGGREDHAADTPPPDDLWPSGDTSATTYCCYATYESVALERPVAADQEMLVTTSARVPIGRVPAQVRWTEVLDGPDRLDSVTLPKWFLKQNGMRVSRPEIAKYGWLVKFGGVWYTLDTVASDNETAVTFRGRSIEAAELSRQYASTGFTPFTRIADVPQDIMDELLGGYGTLGLANADLADTEYVYTNAGYTWIAEWLKMAINTGAQPYEFPPDGNLRPYLATENMQSSGCLPEEYAAYGEPTNVLALAYWHNYGTGTTHYLRWAYPASLSLWLAQYASGYSVYQRGVPTLFGASAGSTITFSCDAKLANDGNIVAWHDTCGGMLSLDIVWFDSDGRTVLGVDREDITLEVNDDGYTRVSVTAERKSEYFAVAVRAHSPRDQSVGQLWVGFRNLYVTNLAVEGADLIVPSDWTYYGAMNLRSPEIPHTDSGWIEFGTWTVGASDIYATVVGNQLVRIVTGDRCTIHFTASGAGALCDVYVDTVLVESDLDVSAATTYDITDLDPGREHIIGVKVAAVKTAVEKLTVSPLNGVTVRWADMDLNECMADLVSKVGGEVHADTEEKRLYHVDAWGQDLLADNIMDLRRGANLLTFTVEARRTEIANHLLYLGYGTGATRLRTVAVGEGVNTDGLTSVEAYGVQWGRYENADCMDAHTAGVEAQAIVNEWQWPDPMYRGTCLDAAAAYIRAGDTVRIYWDADPDDIINVAVRVLEVTRDNEGGPATLIVGSRLHDLPFTLVSTARKTAGLSRMLSI